MEYINLATGRIIDADADSKTIPKVGEALFDPATQEYNATRQEVRKKSPNLDHTLPYKLARLEAKVAVQAAEIAVLRAEFAKLKPKGIS